MLNHAGWLLLPVIAFKSCNFKCPLIKQGVASGTKNVLPRENKNSYPSRAGKVIRFLYMYMYFLIRKLELLS